MSERQVIGRECRFALHLPYIKNERSDTHLIKEIVHYNDGTRDSLLRPIKNFKRPFYLTKPVFQVHKDKKEREQLSKLDKHLAVQSFLPNEIAGRIGMPGYNRNSYRDVAGSPYLYGSDISSTSYLKKMYMDKFPNFNTPYSICSLDIESDIDDDYISVITICMFDKIYTAVLNRLLLNDEKRNHDNDTDVKVSVLLDMYDEYIPKESKLRETIKDVKIEIFTNELELIKNVFKKIHEWKPDFLSIWNMNYDIPYILGRLRLFNVKPEHIICDPSLPDNLKFFEYREGRKIKVTESGKETPLDFSEQWHTVKCSSSFYIIDAMCSYRQIRQGAPTVPTGYGLDSILNTELKLNKLKFKGIPEHLKDKDWHIWMTKNMPFEYVIYNIWDTLGMMELELKTKDLSVSLPMLIGITDFDRTKSGPQQIADELYFDLLSKGYVLGTRDPKLKSDAILGLDKWINCN